MHPANEDVDDDDDVEVGTRSVNFGRTELVLVGLIILVQLG